MTMLTQDKTKIFLDSGDVEETTRLVQLFGYLDGQTTNPTLIARNPALRKQVDLGVRVTMDMVLRFYQSVVEEISRQIPNGSVSIEVYADANTSANDMFSQAKKMNCWIPNTHIKFPITRAGLEAAEQSVREGIRVNMTLCFTQEQAAAVYMATQGATPGQVFISPFIGRLDDIGLRGMDLVRNIIEMYKNGDGHVQVLAASIRGVKHIQDASLLGTDIITAPASVLEEWYSKRERKDNSVSETSQDAPQAIPFKDMELDTEWKNFDIEHELTRKGLERFALDWNELMHEEKSPTEILT